MDHVITTYGGGELFFLVFNGIAALFNEDHTGLVMPMIRIGLMVGSVYVLALMFLRQNLEEGLRWLLWVVIATNLIFLPKTSIMIHDPLTEERFQVDHVPLALGAFASTVSQVGKTVTETIETVFTLPNYMPYHRTGTVFASAIMSQLGKFQIVDPVFRGNMERFVNQCVVYDAMIGHKYSLRDLQNTPDIWGFVRAHASPVLGFMVKTGDGHEGEIMTCRAGAAHLNDQWNEQLQLATAQFGNRVNNRTLTQAAFRDHLLGSARLFADAVAIGQTASQMIQQEMMINALETGSNNKLSELGLATNYASTKALLQQRSAYAVAGEIAARTLPLFKNVIEALSYALFIFIVVLALLPGGYRSLMTYFGILIWTQLWAPLYAVLNLIMSLYGKAETHSLLGADGLTYLNSAAVIGAHTDMMTLAAWFAVSIPFISYGILKQGAGAFVGLAHHLGSAMQSAASSAAAETVSGNISLGNVSMGTQAYQNRSAFQDNTSPSYSASQFKALSSSGVEQSTFGEGGQTFTDQALSKLSVQIMGTENTSFAQEMRLNDAMSVAESKSIAAGQAVDAALQDSAQFLRRASQDRYAGEDYHKTLSASESQSLQDFNTFVKTIQQRDGLTESQATEAAVSASVGGGFSKMSLGVSGSFSSSAQRQQAVENARQIANQLGYNHSLDKVVSAAKAASYGTKDGKGMELGEQAQASLSKARSLREEHSFAQNNVKTLSQDLAAHQSKGMSINKDLTQEVLDFVAHQPINAGPNGQGGEMGYKAARHILESGGAEREAYLRDFQSHNPQYQIQGLDGESAQSALGAHYEASSQALSDAANIEHHHQGYQNDVYGRAERENMSLNNVPSSATRNDANETLSQRAQDIEQGKGDITSQEQNLQQESQKAKDKNMTAAVAKNAWNNIFDSTPLLEQDPNKK